MTRSSENPEVTPTVSVPKKGALNIAQSDARPTRHMAVFFVSPDKRLFPRFTVRADSEFAPSLRENPPQRKYYSNQGQSPCTAMIDETQRSHLVQEMLVSVKRLRWVNVAEKPGVFEEGRRHFCLRSW